MNVYYFGILPCNRHIKGGIFMKTYEAPSINVLEITGDVIMESGIQNLSMGKDGINEGLNIGTKNVDSLFA